MLYLTRKKNQTIIINNEIKITIVDISKSQVRISVECPSNNQVFRGEVVEKIIQENINATKTEYINLDNINLDKKIKKG